MKDEQNDFVSRRTYNVSRSNLVSSSSKVIKENQKILYNVRANSALLKSSSTLTIRQADDTSGATIASTVLNSKQNEFEVFLGDKNSDASASPVQPDGEPFDRYFKFDVGNQPYAWQRTLNHTVRIQMVDGSVEQTMGDDWRLIALDASTPRQGDRVLAACVQQNKPSGAADIHWFEQIDRDVELTSLAVILGMLEQRRKSQKEWSSGTGLLHS